MSDELILVRRHFLLAILFLIPFILNRIFLFFVEDTNVPAGQYQYNFHCNLPAGLPTSLEGDVGYIRYRVRVVLDIPLWPDEEFEDIFTVIKPLNLNYDSTLRVRIYFEFCSFFGLFRCN